MNDVSPKNRLDVSDISQQLSEGRLSRHGLFDRLRGLGIGFGAAFALGVTGAQATSAPEAAVVLKSTNPALNAIIQEGPQLPANEVVTETGPLQQMTYYRVFRRVFSRFYRRF
jgi:hypothetical protein